MSLATVSTADLERLLGAVKRGRLPLPLSGAGLASQKLGHLAAALGLTGGVGAAAGLAGLGAEGVSAVLEAVLAERAARTKASAELVWTGPEGKAGWASPTPQVLAGLLGRAQRSMLVAGYAFDHGVEILAPMHEAMKARGVTVDLFMHIREAPRLEADAEAFARGEVSKFFAQEWPWEPRPEVYYDPRTVRPGGPRGTRPHASLHAKCVVVDERWSLVGSANFTDRGQTRNIEVGVLLEDPSFAQALLRQFRGAAAAGVFVHWLG